MATKRTRGKDLPPNTPKKPMARVSAVPLVVREVRERVSPTALDILLAGSRQLSEGQVTGPPGQQRFFGSTMITIDLSRPGPYVRREADPRQARLLAAAILENPELSARVRAVALRQAERVCGTAISDPDVEIRARAEGLSVHVDVDVEGAVAGKPLGVRTSRR